MYVHIKTKNKKLPLKWVMSNMSPKSIYRL